MMRVIVSLRRLALLSFLLVACGDDSSPCAPDDRACICMTNPGAAICSDAGYDGGICGPCRSAAPFCDEARARCAECLEAAHCTTVPRTMCEVGDCVECLENTDCTDPDRPRCFTGGCNPCANIDDCAHLPATPTCNDTTGACE